MHEHIRSRALPMLALAVATALTMTACSGSSPDPAQTGSGKGNIVIWGHQGQDSENAAIQNAVKDFNASQPDIKATLKLLSGDTYTTTITNTPTSKLPDVLEMDGPTVATDVFNGKLSPLEGLVPAGTISNATSGSIAEGTVDKKLYALAMYDSALGLYGNKKMLDAAGVKYPTSIADAWTPEQFSTALEKLAAKSSGGKSLDIQESYGLAGEWGAYAFSPLLQSAGGNLIKGDKASGTLDSDASVKALTEFASWKKYVDPNADGNAFPKKRVALSWGGHWLYPAYSKALGSDLVALPLPNMGEGAKTGAGSWTWGIGAGSKNGSAAGKFLAFLLNDRNVGAMTTANGAPPATKTAYAADKTYQTGGGLALFGQQLQSTCQASDITSSCVAVFRPVTAGYPTITSQFGKALAAIYGGADVKTQLTNAAKAIDQDFADNNNYSN